MLNKNWTRKSQVSAFTLVELLVVIGIIALLISILLPSLNKARMQAQTLACMANLRSIGQAISIYCSNNRGSLPIGYWNGETTILSQVVASIGKPADIASQSDWSMLLMENVFGKGDGTYATEGTIASPMFQCPAADFSDTANNPLYPLVHKLNYACNPRLMPNIGSQDHSVTTSTVKLVPYKISHIQRSAEVCLIWDAEQVFSLAAYPYCYGSAFPVSDQVDDYGLTLTGSRNGEVCNYLLMGNGVVGNDAIYTSPAPTMGYYANAGVNALGTPYGGATSAYPPFSAEIQWRHGVNQHLANANFLFVDGHVETMALNFGLGNNTTVGINCDVKDKNIYVNPNY